MDNNFLIFFIIVWSIIGAIVGPNLYARRGHNPAIGFLVGIFMGGLGGFILLTVLWVSLKPKQKPCPRCAEKVQIGAFICKYCGYYFNPQYVQAQIIHQQRRTKQTTLMTLGMILIMIVLVSVAYLAGLAINVLNEQSQRDVLLNRNATRNAINEQAIATQNIINEQVNATNIAINIDSTATQNAINEQAIATQNAINEQVMINRQRVQSLDLSYISRNEDWIPLELDFDGVAMVLVPNGCFMMGSNTQIGNRTYEAQQPVHEQCFNMPFWIDKYEVTQEQFQRFGGVKAETYNYTDNNFPVTSITWFEANTFCALRGGKLPTEREWEYVARGPSNFVYSWGNYFIETNINSSIPTIVGTKPEGASWVGVMDMNGNVTEWTSSLYQPYPYYTDDGRERDTGNDKSVERTIRGFALGSMFRSSERQGESPSSESGLLGFRCVRPYIP
jgi:formylglycine-generating enzyme required for sulfatase activity